VGPGGGGDLSAAFPGGGGLIADGEDRGLGVGIEAEGEAEGLLGAAFGVGLIDGGEQQGAAEVDPMGRGVAVDESPGEAPEVLVLQFGPHSGSEGAVDPVAVPLGELAGDADAVSEAEADGEGLGEDDGRGRLGS